MTVEGLYEAFVAEHQSGGPADPLRYLDRVDGVDRRELEALIDAYLARAPRVPFDTARFASSPAAKLVDTIEEVVLGQAGLLPAVLPRLRANAHLTRESLVKRLAEKLGSSDKESKVAGYYHELEQGLIPAERVSPRVFEALGELLGRSAEWLREQGRAVTGGPRSAGPVFARTAGPAVPGAGPRPTSEHPAAANPEQWDDVDRMFLGGP
jgi:hypothetical protein